MLLINLVKDVFTTFSLQVAEHTSALCVGRRVSSQSFVMLNINGGARGNNVLYIWTFTVI